MSMRRNMAAMRNGVSMAISQRQRLSYIAMALAGVININNQQCINISVMAAMWHQLS